ncbi:MAG: DUF3800 domain-containing protein [Alphaproteobacteria bacterium]
MLGWPTGPQLLGVGRTYVILRGHFDDSGSNANEPMYVLAGFLAPLEAWAEFSDAWRIELDRPRPCGGKGIDYFKANEAHRLKAQFEGWSESDRDDRVRALAEIIPKHATNRVSAHISRSEFERAMVRMRAEMPRQDKNFPLTLDPYFLLFYQLVISVSTVRRLAGLGDDCEYIFDNQGALGDRTSGYWENVKANLSDVLRPWAGQKPQHGDDKVILPLQAADMYAWNWRRRLLAPAAPLGPGIDGLREIEPIIREVSREHLDETVDNVIRAWSEASFARGQDF